MEHNIGPSRRKICGLSSASRDKPTSPQGGGGPGSNPGPTRYKADVLSITLWGRPWSKFNNIVIWGFLVTVNRTFVLMLTKASNHRDRSPCSNDLYLVSMGQMIALLQIVQVHCESRRRMSQPLPRVTLTKIGPSPKALTRETNVATRSLSRS